jgi:hypothetical protein
LATEPVLFVQPTQIEIVTDFRPDSLAAASAEAQQKQNLLQ